MRRLDGPDVCDRHAPKLKILYLITRAIRAGAQNHVLDLASAMQPDFEVALATGEEGYLPNACADRNIPAYVLPHLKRQVNPLADVRGLLEICRLMRQFQPDLIHAHTSKAGFLGRLAGRLLRVPSVYTNHGGHFGKPGVSFFWRFIGSPCERLASKWCQRFITVCDEGERLARSCRIADPSKIVTIYNGIKDHPERANLTPGHPPLITMVARFFEPKDHNLLVRAFASLRPGPRLRLVGSGPLQAGAERLARELGVCDRVDFLGDRDDVPSLLASSDLFVLATNFEMLPISILEAMRAGLPVVASDVGGIGELVTHGETGLLVPPGSVSALKEALSSLTDDFDFRALLGRAARDRFCEKFLFTRQVERTRALYQEVLAMGKHVHSEAKDLGAAETGRIALET